ncbi:MAG TPA: hypothetical protein VGM69_04910 [Chloroflexota bacterium]
MGFVMRGRFRDGLAGGAGPAGETAWRDNLIVYRSLDLMAELLAGRPGLGGPLYWAVGRGDPAWDAAPPSADPRARRLVDELFRKPLEAGRDVRYDPATKTLELRVSFGPGEAVGTLREFGVFAGNATGAPGSGYLINYVAHAAVDKAPAQVLERTLQLVFGPGGQ